MAFGDKVLVHTPLISFPGIVVGKEEHGRVQLANGSWRPTVTANVLTLRTTNPANGPVIEYLTVTPENMRFTTMRFTDVIGLDVDEHGARLTLEVLEARRAENIRERQQARLAAQTATIVSLDEDAPEMVPDTDLDPALDGATA